MKKIKMNKKTVATSFTAALFLVIGLSGTMMFFHFFDGNVKSLHEYLGLAFVVAILFHVYFNWTLMQKYFSRKTFFFALLSTFLISSGFIIQSSQQGISPKRIVINSVLSAPVEQSFAILKITNGKKKLEELHLQVSEDTTLNDLAKTNKISPWELIKILSEE